MVCRLDWNKKLNIFFGLFQIGNKIIFFFEIFKFCLKYTKHNKKQKIEFDSFFSNQYRWELINSLNFSLHIIFPLKELKFNSKSHFQYMIEKLRCGVLNVGGGYIKCSLDIQHFQTIGQSQSIADVSRCSLIHVLYKLCFKFINNNYDKHLLGSGKTIMNY